MRGRRQFLVAASVLVLGAGGIALLRAASGVPPKGYVLAEITVSDADAYKQYAAAVSAIVAKLGGRYLVRGGQTVALEGDPPAERIVVIEFESLAAAKAFEASAEYQSVAELRHKAARSRVFLAEGTAQ